MAAALARKHAAEEQGSLHPANFVRDLHQIAELIEICFETQMDRGGRAVVSELKALSYVAPLVWLISLMERWIPGLGTGYVWRAGGRVVGNISLYRCGKHPKFGPGWLIANVAVHPDHRRRGIARQLVEAALGQISRQHGKWAALEVEADNEGAIALYRSVGFETFETQSLWETTHNGAATMTPDRPLEGIRLRRAADIPAEADLIFARARRGALSWTHPIENYHIRDGFFDSLAGLLMANPKQHWLLEDPHQAGRFVGALWLEPMGWQHGRLSLFLDPALSDPALRQSLLNYVLVSPELEGWSLRIEALAGDQPVESLLESTGFRRTRTLTQMRYHLSPVDFVAR